MTYGYVRVSSRDQNEERQIIAMHEFGVDDRQIYIDKQSGKDFDRSQYRKLMRKIKSGDTLVIKSIGNVNAVTYNNGCTRQAANPQHIAKNWLNRQFHASMPNEKWLTDVTEFKWYEGPVVHFPHNAVSSLQFPS